MLEKAFLVSMDLSDLSTFKRRYEGMKTIMVMLSRMLVRSSVMKCVYQGQLTFSLSHNQISVKHSVCMIAKQSHALSTLHPNMMNTLSILAIFQRCQASGQLMVWCEWVHITQIKHHTFFRKCWNSVEKVLKQCWKLMTKYWTRVGKVLKHFEN